MIGCPAAKKQCLMRNLKTTGGLTYGSGMTELQRNIWTLLTPVSAEVHNAPQKLLGLEKKLVNKM